MAFTEQRMQQALLLAEQSLTLSSPNPHVGCVIYSDTGELLGQGHTQRAGAEHAEIMALQDARNRGHSLVGATAYVTLEPCSHQGRTGPCCDALAAAGITKVVASIADPNPLVSGRGFARLRAAGISVEVGTGAAQSRELNIGFFSRMVRRSPWVRMKFAASLDGKTALENGASQWITSETSRMDGHMLRARACALLTGRGTVAHDNPRMDVRGIETHRQPAIVIVDSQLATPADAHVFAANRPRYLYTASRQEAKQAELESAGATVTFLPNGSGQVDLAAMLRDLAVREINEVHVEAGGTLNGALIRDGLVDEFVVYLAPKWIGLGQGMAHFGPLSSLAQAVPLEFHSCTRCGPDLRIAARRSGSDLF